MSRLRVAGVPLWITIIAIVFAVGSTAIGIVALVDPTAVSFTEIDSVLGRGWAGRNLGLGLVTGVAVLLRSKPAYLAAFAGGLGRDLGDLFAAIDDDESVAVPAVVIAIGVCAIAVMLRPTPSVTEHQDRSQHKTTAEAV